MLDVSSVGGSSLVVRCIVDTVRILDTFLDFGMFFHIMDLRGRSTDMLLSLLTSESMHESSSSSPPSSLWTRLTLENLTSGLDWLYLRDDFLPAGGCLSSDFVESMLTHIVSLSLCGILE